MSTREGEEITKNIKKKPTYHQPNWQQCVTHSGGLPEWAGQTQGRSKTRKQNEVLGHFNVFLRKKNNRVVIPLSRQFAQWVHWLN